MDNTSGLHEGYYHGNLVTKRGSSEYVLSPSSMVSSMRHLLLYCATAKRLSSDMASASCSSSHATTGQFFPLLLLTEITEGHKVK